MGTIYIRCSNFQGPGSVMSISSVGAEDISPSFAQGFDDAHLELEDHHIGKTRVLNG